MIRNRKLNQFLMEWEIRSVSLTSEFVSVYP